MRYKESKKVRQEHAQFIRRQRIYENKYKRKFLAYLNAVNKSAADAYENGSLNYNIYSSRLEAIYKQLYTEITIQEAQIQWNEFDDTPIKQKDLIDALASIFTVSTDVPINLWRSLLNDFLTVRIAGRIKEVEQTTRKRIAYLIEKGIADGLGARDVARIIRKDTGFNRNRLLNIARTETITSANQGKYLAASSSPYVKQKKWLPTIDARTRTTHRAMSDVPYVDLTQDFFLQNMQTGALEAAQYPCDTRLSAGNTCNCRCIIIFKNKLDENGRPIKKNSL